MAPQLRYRDPTDGIFKPLTGAGPTGPTGAASTVPGPIGPTGPSGEMFVQPDTPTGGSTPVPAELWVDTDDDSGSNLAAVIDAKGDLIAGTGPDTAARLPVGGNGQVLTADSAQATGIKWAAPAASGSTILSGTAAPTGTTGAVGDYYLDTDDRILYGPKAAGGDPVIETIHTTNTTTLTQSWNYGARYRFMSAGYVLGIDVQVPVGAVATGWEVYLWTAAGALLASQNSDSMNAGTWTRVLFPTPVAVTTGITYVAGFYGPKALYENGSFAGSTVGNVRVLGRDEEVPNPMYSSDARDTFPTTNLGCATLGVAPVFSTSMAGPWPVAVYGVPPGGTTGQVLKKTSGTDYATAWSTPADPNQAAQTLNAQTGTTYTPVTADLGKLVTLNNASPITVTIGTALALTGGQRIDFAQTGAGQITFAASGTTVNGTPGLKCRAQYSAVSLVCLAADSYLLVGDLSA